MITKIYFKEALAQATGKSRKFAGRALHSEDGFVIEDLKVPGTYAVRVSHPKYGTWEVRDVIYEIVDDEKRRELSNTEQIKLGVPSELLSSRLDQIHESAAGPIRQFCSHFSERLREGYGFILTGGPGTGKSSIGAYLAKEAWYLTYSAYFVTPSDLREMIRNKVNFDALSTVMERCRDAKFLVLDGLLPEDAKDIVLDAVELGTLIEHRVRARKSTVLTTRMSPPEMGSLFPLLTSLLRKKSPFLVVEGEDRHKKEAEATRKLLLGR